MMSGEHDSKGAKRLKIVYLAPFGIRPKGTVLARMIPLASELQAMGHEVVIIAPPYTNPDDSGVVEMVAGVKLRNITIGPFTGMKSAPLLAWRMFSAMKAEKPDLIHLFKPKGYGGLAAMLHLLLKGVGLRLPPLFVDTDDWEGRGGMNDFLPYSWAERRLFQFQEQWLLLRATGVTVASRTLETLVWGMGVVPERVLYLPNCVEVTHRGNGLQVRQRLGIPVDALTIILYTRFFEFSQDKLYDLFGEVNRRVDGVRFLVVGTGRRGEEQQLPVAALERGFHGALVMAGWVEPESLPDYLAAGDLAVYPFADTLINRAKCPAKLTELLLVGLPVVADNVGQLAEYIKPDLSGILCSPDDWQEMADRTVELLQNSMKREVLGQAGRHYLLERFSWQKFAGKLNAFYMRSKTEMS